MKKNSNFTSYIILSVAICLCIGILTCLGISLFHNTSLKAANFKEMSKEEIMHWISENNIQDSVSFEYEYSENIDEGNIISQNVKPNEKIDDNLVIVISKGNYLELDLTSLKTKTDFENFIKDYPSIVVSYKDSYSDDKAIGEIIKVSKEKLNLNGDNVVVNVSLGKLDKENDDENNNKDDKTDTKTAIIPNNLLGISEKDFLEKITKLGFTKTKKDTNKYYSFTSSKDTIFSYDDGKFYLDRTINYAISLGSYVDLFKASDYDGKLLDDAKKVANDYNKLNAHISLNVINKEVENSKDINKLSNCKCVKDGTNSKITCNIGVEKTKTVNIGNYVGKTESEFKTILNNLGFKNLKQSYKYSNFAVNTIYDHDKGDHKTTDTINYIISKGIYTPNLNEYNGKTLNQAKSTAGNYNKDGAKIEIVTKEEKTNSYTNNTLYDCSYVNNGESTKITCSLAQNFAEPVLRELSNSQYIKTEYSSQNYDETCSKLKTYLKDFKNVEIKGVESAVSVGTIVKVSVNGSEDYKNGKYDVDATTIYIEVCKTRLE